MAHESNPVKRFLKVPGPGLVIDALVWAAAINGILAAPLLVLMMVIANNRRVMDSRVNGIWSNLLGWVTTMTMATAAVGLFVCWGK